jgi:hypothetical protein
VARVHRYRTADSRQGGPQFLDVSRRDLFRQGLGLSAAGLATLLARDLPAAAAPAPANPLAPHAPHFPPRAKAVIHLHMVGAPSQLDMFDPKPELVARDGENCPQEISDKLKLAFIGDEKRLSGSGFSFQRHGQAGLAMNEHLPHLAGQADNLCMIHSLHTDEINHAPAQMFLHSGFGRGGRPSLGAWTTYGLGSESEDLPAYVVLLSGPPGGAGSQIWSNGFLPSIHQGVRFRSDADPVLALTNAPGRSRGDQRRVIDAVTALNDLQLADTGDPEIATRISQYEMAFRMQASVPELTDISNETEETLALYGVEPGKPSFAANCLLARRLVERGVRFVQLFDSDWDHHGDLDSRLPKKCLDVDQGMAALLADLRRRGLLDETLVVWGSEFGRTPLAQGTDSNGKKRKLGRDHHKDAFTMWLSGGGVKQGINYGATDDLGFSITKDPVHVHDLNATILHLLGLEHTRLTFRHQGRDYRLTDVHGNVLSGLLA